MTNLEKIKQMYSEEYYINWIYHNLVYSKICKMYEEFCKENNEIYITDRKRFADWLNEEVKE